MPVGSSAGRQALLRATVRAETDQVPASLYLAFFDDDPTGAGVEIAATGGRISIPMNTTFWAAPTVADATTDQVLSTLQVATSQQSTAWTSAATHIALMSSASFGDVWHYGELSASVQPAQYDVVAFAAGNLGIVQS